MENQLDEWLLPYGEKIRLLFPETWTHQSNLNVVQLMFQFKLIGIDWRTQEQLAIILAASERLGFILRNPENKFQIKRGAPRS